MSDTEPELAGITCARCDKLAPITAAELRRSDDRPEDILDDPDLPVVVPTPDGWFGELEDAVEHGGEPIQHDVSEHEFSERIVCPDCATDEERTAQALGGASHARAGPRGGRASPGGGGGATRPRRPRRRRRPPGARLARDRPRRRVGCWQRFSLRCCSRFVHRPTITYRPPEMAGGRRVRAGSVRTRA